MLGAGIAVSLICIIFFRWSPEEKGIQRMGDFSEEELSTMQIKSSLSSGYSFSQAVRRPIFWFLLLSTTLAVIASSSILQHGIPTMIYGGYSAEAATGIISLRSTIMIFTGPIIGVIMDKAPLLIAACGSALCFAGSCIGLSLISTNPGLGVGIFCCLYIFGVASINIISPVIMSFLFGEKDMPKLLSWLNMFIAIGGSLGAVGVSAMLQHFGSYAIPWIVMAVVLFICAIIRLFATMKKRQYHTGDENNKK